MNQYTEEVREYVKTTLSKALTVSFADEMAEREKKEEMKLELVDEISEVSGLRNELVNLITAYSMKNCAIYYKPDLSEPTRKEHFMNAIKSFCYPSQCLTLAYHFKEEAKQNLNKNTGLRK